MQGRDLPPHKWDQAAKPWGHELPSLLFSQGGAEVPTLQ